MSWNWRRCAKQVCRKEFGKDLAQPINTHFPRHNLERLHSQYPTGVLRRWGHHTGVVHHALNCLIAKGLHVLTMSVWARKLARDRGHKRSLSPRSIKSGENNCRALDSIFAELFHRLDFATNFRGYSGIIRFSGGSRNYSRSLPSRFPGANGQMTPPCRRRFIAEFQGHYAEKPTTRRRSRLATIFCGPATGPNISSPSAGCALALWRWDCD